MSDQGWTVVKPRKNKQKRKEIAEKKEIKHNVQKRKSTVIFTSDQSKHTEIKKPTMGDYLNLGHQDYTPVVISNKTNTKQKTFVPTHARNGGSFIPKTTSYIPKSYTTMDTTIDQEGYEVPKKMVVKKFNKKFIARIKQARGSFTQKEFAPKIGITIGQLKRIENGTEPFSITIQNRIVSHLNKLGK